MNKRHLSIRTFYPAKKYKYYVEVEHRPTSLRGEGSSNNKAEATDLAIACLEKKVEDNG